MPPLQPSACFPFFFPSSISNNSPLAQLAGERIVALGPLVFLLFFLSEKIRWHFMLIICQVDYSQLKCPAAERSKCLLQL